LNDWVKDWESRPEEIKKLTDAGIVPIAKDMEEEKEIDMPFLMGQVSGLIGDIKPAGQIVRDMVTEAVDMLKLGQSYLGSNSKL
jgi:hypothetical protein